MGFSDIDEVWCNGYTKSYILKNLKVLRGQSGILEHNKIGFFEYVYEVDYFAYFTGRVHQGQKF
ncbi:hypothetical protein [Francisella halioticida]|uniref:hypothetical protein n=1 Tax=Francisella halioticida TaxID=549298 RepID=UPI001B800147|nr:hypothetical protein [Francisella halioticida]